MPKTEELPITEDDGSRIDYLDEDPEIPNQRYCIISFLSPEKVIQDKKEFYFREFITWMDYQWKVKGLEHLMAFVSKKYSIKIDDLLKDAEDFVKVRNDEVKATDVHEEFQVFMLKREKELQEAYDSKVNFRTNIRGVKVRRAFPSIEETQMFAKVLQRKYPKDNLFIGKVGCWLPWDPSEHLMPEVEYAERELNELMRKYKENEVNKEMFFAEQRDESIKKQKEENERRRKANALEAAGTTNAATNAAAASGPAQLSDLSVPTHPTEGVIRE
jgi:hypothetical protein